jgi:hypothetical protein
VAVQFLLRFTGVTPPLQSTPPATPHPSPHKQIAFNPIGSTSTVRALKILASRTDSGRAGIFPAVHRFSYNP